MTDYVIYTILIRTDSNSALNGENLKHLRCRLSLGRAHSNLYGVKLLRVIFYKILCEIFQVQKILPLKNIFFTKNCFLAQFGEKCKKK